MAAAAETSRAGEEGAAEDPPALLRSLERAAISLRAVTRLDLRHSSIVALPSALAACRFLSFLDVGSNPALTSLDGIRSLTPLTILFATGCGLGPELQVGGELAELPNLRMLSLKSNGLRVLHGGALPTSLEWLIAQSNEIDTILDPERLHRVRKCMLSHNRLTEGAVEALLKAIPNMHMLRLACNRLESLPEALLRHPTLAWVALGGNPYAVAQARKATARTADGNDASGGVPPLLSADDQASMLTLGSELGAGSGGKVYRGDLRGSPVAVKIFTASHFSDGSAETEWAMATLVGSCPHAVRTVARLDSDGRKGLCLQLLEGARPLAQPPSFSSVTRDTWSLPEHALSPGEALRVAIRVSRACAWFHARGCSHSDVYLHNVIACRLPSGALDDVRLSDLGAASAYDRDAHGGLEAIEVRAFGCLLDDLLQLADSSAPGMSARAHASRELELMDLWARRCVEAQAGPVRPTFEEVALGLESALHLG